MAKKKTRHKHPLESTEQIRVVNWLEDRGLLYCHVPNGAALKGGMRAGAMLKAQGVRRGVPDLLVFEPTDDGYVGIAVEMKRISGGRTSAEQIEWINALNSRGWYAFVAKGADEAIRKLEELFR